MTRLPRPRPDELDERQRQVYDAIAGGSRSTGPRLFPLTDGEGRLEGPFNAMLLSPAVGDALQRLGAAIRYQGGLSARAREIAILIVAAAWDCEYEQRAHESVGVHVGLSVEELAAIRSGAPLALSDEEESGVATATRLLLTRRDLDTAEYDAAVAALGTAKLFELTTLVGYYSLLALQMRVFDVG